MGVRDDIFRSCEVRQLTIYQPHNAPRDEPQPAKCGEPDRGQINYFQKQALRRRAAARRSNLAIRLLVVNCRHLDTRLIPSFADPFAARPPSARIPLLEPCAEDAATL